MRDVDAGGRELTGEIGALHSRITKLEQVSHDLPRHKNNMDEELDSAWREWEATFDAAKDSIILTDGEFKIVQANLAASRFFDRPLEQIIGKTCWQLVHGTDHPPEECPLKRAKTTKKHEEIELHLPQNGIWAADSVDPVLDQQGRLTGAVHIIKDITDRKQAEQLLRRERDRAQQYLDVAGVMFVAIDAEQRVGLINKKGCEILGYNEDEIVAKNWFDNFLPETVKEEVRTVFEKVVRGELDASEYYENPILTQNGDQRLIAWHNTVLRDDKGQVVATLSSGEDITEQKKAEEALQHSEEYFRAITENSSDIIIVVDKKGTILYVSSSIERFSGYKPEELIGKSAFEFIHPDDFPRAINDFGKAIQTKDVAIPNSFRIKHKDGSEFVLEGVGKNLLDNPVIKGLVMNVRDITERKKAEEALRESEERFRRFYEQAPLGYQSLNAEACFIDVNQAWLDLLGYSRDQVIGHWFGDFLAPQEVDVLKQRFPRFKAAGEVHVDLEMVQHAGSTIIVHIDGRIAHDEHGQFKQTHCILHDITERKKAEQKLLEDRAQLKSLASELTLAEEHERRRLATELHDQIGQSLVISKIKLDALRKLGHSRKLDKALEEVCNSLGQTIQDTRALTFNLGSPVLYELGFEAAVSEWLTSQIQKKHGLTAEFEDDREDKPLDDDVRILLFRDVRELLINVVKHAGAHKVKVSLRKLDNHICVTVEDDGGGFDPVEVLAGAARRGEFGLFSIRERLEDLGGHLQIDAAPGHGCQITMTAPLKQKEMTR